jgi:hypothetical protein
MATWSGAHNRSDPAARERHFEPGDTPPPGRTRKPAARLPARSGRALSQKALARCARRPPGVGSPDTDASSPLIPSVSSAAAPRVLSRDCESEPCRPAQTKAAVDGGPARRLQFVLLDTDAEPSPDFRSLRVTSTLGADAGRAVEIAQRRLPRRSRTRSAGRRWVVNGEICRLVARVGSRTTATSQR